MFTGNREELRQYYFLVWEKYHKQLPLEPLEQQILQVITEHPEYHHCFLDPDTYKYKDYRDGETNPFLHMALHLAIREQVSTNRPEGVYEIYQQYVKQHKGDHLQAEHDMLEILIDIIWNMQRHHEEFNEREYLIQLQERLTGVKHKAANEEW